VPIPSIVRIPAPIIDIHFLNSGALLSSQPVTPPNRSIGDKAVPRPNRIAKAKLSIGAPKDTEYRRSSSSGGHTINPLVNPSKKARKSNLPLIPAMLSFLVSCAVESQGFDLLFKSILKPIIIVTIPKAYEE
jgi:hypothetical protein